MDKEEFLEAQRQIEKEKQAAVANTGCMIFKAIFVIVVVIPLILGVLFSLLT